MDKKKKSMSSGGSSFVGLLTLVFIVLKLCGVITWSWWWVLAPLWIPVGLIILAVVVLTLLAVLFGWDTNHE